MAFRYQLRLADGEDAGEAAFGYCPSAGDVIHLDGNRAARVLAVIPLEIASEFVDKPVYGILEIDPI